MPGFAIARLLPPQSHSRPLLALSLNPRLPHSPTLSNLAIAKALASRMSGLAASPAFHSLALLSSSSSLLVRASSPGGREGRITLPSGVAMASASVSTTSSNNGVAQEPAVFAPAPSPPKVLRNCMSCNSNPLEFLNFVVILVGYGGRVFRVGFFDR